MYRNNYHYNLLNLKGLVVLAKHSKKYKEPKASKDIFESKIKAIDKDINFDGEKLTLTQILLSIFKYCQSKVNSNESTNNNFYPERIYKQAYN